MATSNVDLKGGGNRVATTLITVSAGIASISIRKMSPTPIKPYAAAGARRNGPVNPCYTFT
jgi:hypothetical protein